MEAFISEIINVPNDFIWKYLVYILVGIGLYFTFRFRFIQFQYFFEMFRIVGRSRKEIKECLQCRHSLSQPLLVSEPET